MLTRAELLRIADTLGTQTGAEAAAAMGIEPHDLAYVIAECAKWPLMDIPHELHSDQRVRTAVHVGVVMGLMFGHAVGKLEGAGD